ncbi:MAG TPA: hypothetical protein VFO01_04890 [Trebonia sp.]|nr:hypothetical protein [Trebonia sp.]
MRAQPPVVLWAVPRSVSTAFEKTFTNSPQFSVIHEPFTDCYYFGEERRSDRYGNARGNRAHSGADACRHILTVGKRRYFVKELCFQAEPYIDDQFLTRITSTFIVRRPDVIFASLEHLKPDFTEHEFGFTALERIWDRVRELTGSVPTLVDGERFREDPEGVLSAYCKSIGAAYDPGMLRWADGRIRNWAPHEAESQAKWHRTLEQSAGILPPSRRPTPLVAGSRQHVLDEAWRIYRKVTGTS